MKLNVFGTLVEVVRSQEQWKAFYPGNDGKKQPAVDIIIPSDICKEDVIAYISDLCHEWARPGNMQVKLIED